MKDVRERPKDGNVSSTPSPHIGSFLSFRVFFVALITASRLAWSTNTITAERPMPLNCRSHVDGSSAPCITFRYSSPGGRFLFLPFLSDEYLREFELFRSWILLFSPSKWTFSILPFGSSSCVESNRLICASVASKGTFTRYKEREVVTVGTLGWCFAR